jgi:phage/plasmid-associated DNA primase
MFLQEPEDYRINSAQIKSLTGNDRQYTREIFEKAKYMVQSAMIVIVSNGSLDLTKCDEAALSRIVVIPFESTFITSRMAHRYTGIVDSIRVHVADPGFEDELHKYTQHFFYILTVYYTKYLREGLIIPQVIRDHTDAYVMRCNPMLHFIKTHVRRSDGSVTSIYALYEMFKDWMRRTSPARTLPSMQNFLDDMRSNGLEPTGNMFYDITVHDDETF